ncbi:cell envelope integrity protein TolA [Gloeobacter kilaueensis]|uniref:TonB family protein n=1 Tax=Gloeobacter kilaueensis (strain ATCC BAA-2537 / CCAP 1431/1 / ULC 316 / JS1) TaxID=1183438 RepID=U5QPU9_GLOK1|nr:cell envelope integrity protein TolA [Gloeobacter kilaueensis]AGY59654.1 TonB family protein [Gloeobacter kilaueensis JS1]
MQTIAQKIARRAGRGLSLLVALYLLVIPATYAWGYDRTNFPIRVYIAPVARYPSFPNSAGEAVPQQTAGALQQGFLDWVNILLSTPSRNAAENSLVVLRPQAEERQAKALLAAGLFSFSPGPDKADLYVEVLRRTPISDSEEQSDGVTGRYATGGPWRFGKIQIIVNQSQGGAVDEFALRTALMHEIGHALGLAHRAGEHCNLMSAHRFTCTAPFPTECREGASDGRCIEIATADLRYLQRSMLAEPGQGPNSAVAEISSYKASVIERIRRGLISLNDLKPTGAVLLHLDAEGRVETLQVQQSFGNPQLDGQVVEGIRKLAPFGHFPASWKDPGIQFSFSLGP